MPGDDLERARLLLDLGRPREAADLASRVVAAQPGDADGWVVLARSLESMDQPARALEVANRAIGLDPNAAEPHLIASRALRALMNMPLAIKAGQEAVRLAPMEAAAHVNLAIALASKSRGHLSAFGHVRPRHLRLAAQHAAHAVRLAPYSTSGHFASGFVAAAASRRRLALQNYRQVLKIDPQHAAAHNNIAAIELGRGRLTKGGSGFARALSSDPSMQLARSNMRTTARRLSLRFHAVGWSIYVIFGAGIPASNDHRYTVQWSPRLGLALIVAGLYVSIAAFAWRRLDPRIRRFARGLVRDGVRVRMALTADAVTAVCFVILILGQGSSAPSFYAIGFFAIAISGIGHVWVVRSRARRAE